MLKTSIKQFPFYLLNWSLHFLFAVISFFMLNTNIYLLLAATAILVWIIPGFILNATFKKLHHAERN
ncbi:MAG TPA: hypothetical protein VN958_21995 [Chitinophagaceae bacterium]|nr:hypothetical protein [Chitinophagaceae bacterium]